MKKTILICIIVLFVSVIASCVNNEQTVDLVHNSDYSSEKVVIDPYQDLSLAIEAVNQTYEGIYTTRSKTKWWQYVFGVIGFPFADAFGGASITINNKDGFGILISGDKAVATSIKYWDWATQDLTKNETNQGIFTQIAAPKRSKGTSSISVTVNTQALPALNGNKLEDNYGFLHNKTIIDLYSLYGDDLKNLPDEEFSTVLSEKIESIVHEYGLVSNETNSEGSDCSSQIAAICYENDNISDIIMACKELNPSLSREYDILAVAFGELLSSCFPEEIVYQYTQEISTVVDQSLLSEESKRMIKASVSIFGASSQLWEVTEE